MTGFGRGRATFADHAVAAEVRSVNGRGREVRVRLPAELAPLESQLREQVQGAVARGRVDVAIRWDGPPPTLAAYRVNRANAEALLAAANELQAALGLAGAPRVIEILRLPGVIETLPEGGLDIEQLGAVVTRALAAALDEHRQTREREGAQLAADLRRRAQEITRLSGEIGERVAALPDRQAQALRQRVAQLLGEIPIDEGRLAQEIALAAQRSDVTEERVRLDAHLARLNALFEGAQQEIGQSIDFLVQEIRREVNTLTTKAGDPEVDARALSIKTELERLREQAANLE